MAYARSLASNEKVQYNANPFTDPHRASYKFSLHPDPSRWGYDVSPGSVDADDWLHKPEKNINDTGSIWNTRGIPTIGCLLLLILCLVGLFLGFPLQDAIRKSFMPKNGGYNLGGINATGQIMEGVYAMVDKETPQNVRTKVSPVDGRTMQLVFSDEFNQDGRTFWPGDDPFWEAADLYYWNTADLEYYDPQQAYTKDGHLVLELRQTDPIDNHNQSYAGGMITSWNKFCFTGGLIEGPYYEHAAGCFANSTNSQCAASWITRTRWFLACSMDDGQSRKSRLRCNDRRTMALQLRSLRHRNSP